MATKTESFLSRALAKSRTSSELSTSSEEDNMIHGMTRQHSLENFRLEADRDGWKEIHGFRGNMHWNSPCQVLNEGDSVVRMSSPSRRRDVHYEDEPYVFHQKIKLLASMISDSRCCCVYSGKDLATTTEISSKKHGCPQKMITKTATKPTLTHHAITALHNNGHVHYWIQQYHDDGLPQKSGYPQEKLNEIHGSHYDPSNPVVGDEGILRSDLFESLKAWEHTTDLSLCIGTSKSGGMRSDSVFRAVCHRSRQGIAIGGVVISTRKSSDELGAALKIYANSDHVMEALLTQLHMYHTLPNTVSSDQNHMNMNSWYLPEYCIAEEKDVFLFPSYNHKGNNVHDERTNPKTQPFSQYESHRDEENVKHCLRLDLRVGAKVVIRGGVYSGSIGEVIEKTHQGHYHFIFKSVQPTSSTSPSFILSPSCRRLSYWQSRSMGSVTGNESGYCSSSPEIEPSGGDTFEAFLGLWWLQSAARGTVAALPVINLEDEITN